MSEREQERKEKYQRVRSDFDELNTEEKVIFLMEATVSTVAKGIDAFGRAVSDEMNKAFSKRAEKKRGPEPNGDAGGADASTNGDASSGEGTGAESDEKGGESS